MLPRIAFHFHNGTDFFAGVFGVPFIDDIAEGRKLVVALSAVYTIIHRNKVNIMFGKHDLRIHTDLQIITSETVCLLSKLQSKEHIEIEVKMDELDLTSAESKATYEEIREYVFEHTGLKVSHLYIAQVKQEYGIIERENYNKPKSENAKQPQCPPEKEKAITEALKHFGMI